MSQKPVSEMDLLEILVRLMDLRAWAEKRKKDPWAFRQAIILILELDTAAAKENGVKEAALEEFDRLARIYAKEFLERAGHD